MNMQRSKESLNTNGSIIESEPKILEEESTQMKFTSLQKDNGPDTMIDDEMEGESEEFSFYEVDDDLVDHIFDGGNAALSLDSLLL